MNIRNLLKVILMTALVLSSLHFSSRVTFAESKEADIVFEQENNGEDIIKLKENLRALGFDSFGDITAEYNESTVQAVESFQKHFGLEVSGLLDEMTLATIDNLLSSQFQLGKQHEEIVTLKQHLIISGYLPSTNSSSLYDDETMIAVENFQTDYHLPVSGMVDDITWSLIEEQATGPLKNPMYRADVVDLKIWIEAAGFGSFSKTNFFGPQTEETLKAFQSYYDLTVDGVADDQTISKLKKIVNSPFQTGQRHPDTVILKEYLAVLGYWDSEDPTTLFGSKTEHAVKAFQSAHNLQVSGIAEEKTWAKLTALGNAPLQNPMYRQDVVPTKEKLESLGFGSFSKTTYFGPQTEQAIKDFQAYYGLTVDGIVGSSTLTKLNDEASTPLQSGNRHDDTVKLKEYLYTLGFWDAKGGTTLFGSQTEQAVKDFQKTFGLRATGLADSKTWTKLKQEATRSLRNPMYRDDAITLKENLEILGFGSFLKTDYFGPQTERALSEFQAYYGLATNGAVDQVTLDKINDLLANPLRNGQRDERTVTLKEHLYVLGLWDSTTGTTLYGSQTEAAVKSFQAKHSLPVSGKVDSKTWDKLESQVIGPLKNPMYRDDAITLKENLETLGFGSFVKTDYFGPQTERALSQLQQYYGATASGIVDEDTLTLIEDILKNTLQNGFYNDQVITLKENLKALGFWPHSNTPNDYFGPQTKRAVMAFQENSGLVVNGLADQPTLEKIEELLDHALLDFELEVVRLVNVERNKIDLPPLAIDYHASLVARVKSKDMIEHNYFAHTSPTYGSPREMVDFFGIDNRGVGENIAYGYFTAADVVAAWMNSDGHRQNILRASYTHIGVGYENTYWTQIFLIK